MVSGRLGFKIQTQLSAIDGVFTMHGYGYVLCNVACLCMHVTT